MADHLFNECSIPAELSVCSISLDVSSDRRVLYVHAMYADDPELVRRQIKEGFERRLLRITRGLEREDEP